MRVAVNLFIRIISAACLLVLVRCASNSLSGNEGSGTRTGNPIIMTGMIMDSAGHAASGVQAIAIPSLYNPVAAGTVPDSLMDTTDSDGMFIIHVPHYDVYNIQAFHLTQKTRLLIRNIRVAKDTTAIAGDTLRKPGTIKVVLPTGFDTNYGYFYIPGTSMYSWLSDNNGTVTLDSVPACVNLSVHYAVMGSSALPQMVRDSIIVAPGGIMNVVYPEWKFSKKLVLNTTASGAGVAGAVTDFPVLVRLSSINFDFSMARSGGADVRFTKSDGTPLPYEIESWDSANNAAAIWVRVDTVQGNNGTQLVMMYWGNSSAVSQSNGAAVFDTAGGFSGVWHLGQQNNTMALDATLNHYDGTPSDTAPEAVPGAIGTAQKFIGKGCFIEMQGTASGKLDFPENGYYSLSAWVYIDSLNLMQAIAGKGDEQYFLALNRDGLPPLWQFEEYHVSGFQITEGTPVAGTWKHLVGVRRGTAQFFYVDGVLVDSTIRTTPGGTPRFTTNNFTIGKTPPLPSEATNYFFGQIDEVRVARVAYNKDWVRLCYMNQKTDEDALVVFK
jgi:hypothetical protein